MMKKAANKTVLQADADGKRNRITRMAQQLQKIAS